MRQDRHGRARRADNDRRRRPADGFRAADAARFERLVADACASMPDEVAATVAAAKVTVVAVPPVEVNDDEVVLVRYDAAKGMSQPALTVYRRPLEARAVDAVGLLEIVRAAIALEVADALGVDLGEEWDLGDD